MKKTFLFDFDGTLVDSMPTYSGVMLRILDQFGVSYPPDVIKIITPLGLIGTAEYFVDVLKVKSTVSELVLLMKQYMYAEYASTIPAKSGVIDTLKALKSKGHSLNVLTASPHETLDVCLKRLGIWELFDNVWSCNDFATTKADPEIYRQSAKALGVDVSRVIFLDDNLGADLTALSAGMTVYGVYDLSSAEYEQEMRQKTHKYVYEFKELLEDER